MNAHLGVIKVNDKVHWKDQHGPHLGRVESTSYCGGIYWARVSYLPRSSIKKEAWIPLSSLTILWFREDHRMDPVDRVHRNREPSLT